ncbi:MAG: hypothetical protein PHY45_08175 [Rhodocyclaceae bacterium]|nr:hypothetical protein [Rhodocyclaceae bacterium]
MTFSSKTLIAIAIAIALALAVAAAAAVFLYAAYDYASSVCYADMHKTGLDQDTAQRFDSVGELVTGLRKGTADTPKWDDREFQDEAKVAAHLLANGRRALKRQDAFEALKAVAELKKSMARAKGMATNRVNHILQVQDPADYDAFEKYRLEGKMLVEIVKQIDAALETLSRPQKLPGLCDW